MVTRSLDENISADRSLRSKTDATKIEVDSDGIVETSSDGDDYSSIDDDHEPEVGCTSCGEDECNKCLKQLEPSKTLRAVCCGGD